MISPPGDKKMDQCSRVPRSKRLTHNYSRVYGIVQIGNIRDSVDPAEFHVDSSMDVD